MEYRSVLFSVVVLCHCSNADFLKLAQTEADLSKSFAKSSILLKQQTSTHYGECGDADCLKAGRFFKSGTLSVRVDFESVPDGIPKARLLQCNVPE